MKELIEKFNNAIISTNFKVDGVTHVDVDKASTLCAEIAASHYENKWISVDIIKPEGFMDIKGKLDNNVEVVCYFEERLKEFIDDDGNIYKLTHWQPLPTPPNSDKNVEECDATEADKS